MYPEQELKRLAAQKAALQKEIALGRIACAQAAARVAKPLEWLDRVTEFWRKLSPLAKLSLVPLGALARRFVMPRFKLFGSLLRWVPLVFGVARSVGSAFVSHSGLSRRE
jgi:hypothetical protein